MIDVHVHAFPDVNAGRTWQEVAGFPAVRAGTVADLVPRMAAARIEHAVVLLFPRSAHRLDELRSAAPGTPEPELIARVAEGIRALNRWGCDLARSDRRFSAFVGVDPRFLRADEIVAEIELGRAAGAAGVKIIPPAMRLYADDPLLDPVFRACAELGMPILSQSGSGGSAVGPRGPFGRPAAFAAILRTYPSLRLVLAHLGRGCEDELVDLVERFPGVHADTSLALGHPLDPAPWDPGPLRALIRRLRPDRVMFGTNYPTVDPVEYVERFSDLGLGAEEAAAIGHDNAAALLAI